MSDLLQKLKAVRDLLASPNRWIKGAEATDANQESVSATSPRARNYCLIGAARKIDSSRGGSQSIKTYLEDCVRRRGFDSLPDFNDEDSRKHVHIVNFLNREIERLARRQDR